MYTYTPMCMYVCVYTVCDFWFICCNVSICPENVIKIAKEIICKVLQPQIF